MYLLVNGGTPHPVPPPYGSLDSRHPLTLCGVCHNKLITLVFRFAGREVPPLDMHR